jgi:hypothetical protein
MSNKQVFLKAIKSLQSLDRDSEVSRQKRGATPHE